LGTIATKSQLGVKLETADYEQLAGDAVDVTLVITLVAAPYLLPLGAVSSGAGAFAAQSALTGATIGAIHGGLRSGAISFIRGDAANEALAAVFPLMIGTMTLLLMIQLQNLPRVLLVLATAPLGLIGAVLALLLTDQPFGFVALLGLIALAGMIMRNTVILVDQVRQDLADGRSLLAAIVESTVRRARPVVLTALAAMLAFIPLSFNVFWGPMALVMIGGLAVATGLTLMFLPALYAWVFRVT
jgi:hypothetical protein